MKDIKDTEDTSAFPAMGRALLWLDKRKNVNRIVYGICIICAGLFVADFLYYKKVGFDIEKTPGFYALYGFFMSSALVICAKGMQIFLKKPEDYYAPHDTQSEQYPVDQLDRIDVDD